MSNSQSVDGPSGGEGSTVVTSEGTRQRLPATKKQRMEKQPKKQNNQKKNPPKPKQPRALVAEDKQFQKIFDQANQIEFADEGSDDEAWSTDMSAEAIQNRRQQGLGAGNLGNIAAGSMTEQEVQQTIQQIVEDSGDQSTEDRIRAIRQMQKEESFGAALLSEILFELFFPVEEVKTNVAAALQKSKDYLQAFCENWQGQRVIIGLLEQLVLQNDLLGSWKDLLFAFYDCDILQEDYLLQWYDVPTTDYSSAEDLERLRDEAAPFIDWLGNEDSEEEEEEED